MKEFTIYYRAKGSRYGIPMAQQKVLAENWEKALELRNNFDKTWHSIFCNGKRVMTLNRVRFGVDVIL